MSCRFAHLLAFATAVLATGAALLAGLVAPATAATSNGANGDIVFARSADLRLLSTGTIVEAAASQPTWSPDGTKLAFVQSGLIKTCTVSSGSCTSVTSTGVTGTEPTWSPSGSKLAYVTAGSQIHTMATDGTGDTTVTSGATDLSPSWSADGSQLVFTRNGAIAKVAATGGSVTAITTTGVSGTTQPDWSPDGATIAFQSGSPAQIYVVAAAGGSVTQVTNTSETESAPIWSPDGTSIVYAQTSGSNAIYEVIQDSGGAWGSPQVLDTAAGDATPERQTKAPVAVSAPSITGGFAPQTGNQLTSTRGSWQGASTGGYSYQWQRCNSSGASCATIGGATGATYAVVSADVGGTLRVVVTASNPAGSTASSASSASGTVTLAGVVNPPSNTALPAISLPSGQSGSSPLVGTTLTASQGTWTGSFPLTYTYQWKQCEAGDTLNGPCFAIRGETSSSFTVPATLYGRRIRVEVTATNSAAAISSNSAASEIVSATAATLSVTPQISGLTVVGQQLTLTSGTWNGSAPIAYTYAWRRCDGPGTLTSCVAIPGATASSYTPVVADIAATLRVWVTGSNAAGSALAITNHTFPIVDKQHFAPTVATPPLVTGTTVTGSVLTADPGEFDGDDPIKTALQWQRCDATGQRCHTVPKATKKSYVLTLADVGSTLRLAVTATNALGAVTATSTPGDPVLGMPDRVPGKRIVGSAKLHFLLGTPADDVITGGPGNETIDGNGGYDTIKAGNGSVVIIVRGPGSSRITGGTGSATIYAANGYRDTITCIGVRDRVIADPFDNVTKSCASVTRRSASPTP